MKVVEEVDALRGLGLEQLDHLTQPQVLALLLVASQVVAYSAPGGGVGRRAASRLAPRRPRQHLNQRVQALTCTLLCVDLFKRTLYAVLRALAGCREGLLVRLKLALGRSRRCGWPSATTWNPLTPWALKWLLAFGVAGAGAGLMSFCNRREMRGLALALRKLDKCLTLRR